MTRDTANWVGLQLADGRYAVQQKLGEGGMAHVYQARDTLLERNVVIKVPRRAVLEEAGFSARFTREVRALSQLAHPNVVKVLDVGDQGLLARELLQIRQFQEAGADLVPYCDLVAGDPVRIADGPFKGYRGIVLQTQGRLRLLVSISMLRQSVAVEFERDVIVPVRVDSASWQKDRSAAVS